MTTATEPLDTKRAANVIIGERIHTLMWRGQRTQRDLGALLGVDQGSVSKRLRGKTNWTAIELLAVAAWLGVPMADLVPEIEIVGPDDGPDAPAGSAPSRARTYDLRITRPSEVPLLSVGLDEVDQVTAA